MGAALSYSVCTNDYTAFDDPYPATPFKSLLATCAQMWQLFDHLRQEPHDAPPIVTDAITGCSMRFHEELSSFLKQEQSERSAHHEDIAYLAHIVEQLVSMHDQVEQDIHFHHSVRHNLIQIYNGMNACKDHQSCDYEDQIEKSHFF
jgi:hypothetical protein